MHLYRDAQNVPALTCCKICGGETYDKEEGRICWRCREERDRLRNRYDQKTAHAVIDEVWDQLTKYLSEELCMTVNNILAERFLIHDEEE